MSHSPSHPPLAPVSPHLRREYTLGGLDSADLRADPMDQFARWFAEAQSAGVPEANAMTLATADACGAPSARVVLLKGLDADSFVFFTNYESRKGRDLAVNPRAALCFYWQMLERQVRIEGAVEKTSRIESETYFHSRPLAAQIGAWASHQSRVISSRAAIEQRNAELTEQFATGPVPLPEFWGGYRLIPRAIEFWQGRPSRLHDRFRYTRQSDSHWLIERLSP